MADPIAFLASMTKASLKIWLGLTIAAACMVFLVDHSDFFDDAEVVKQIRSYSQVGLVVFASLSLVGCATAATAYLKPKAEAFLQRRSERLAQKKTARDDADAARQHLWTLDDRALLYLAWMVREDQKEGFYRSGNVALRQLANRGFITMEYGKVDLNDQKVTVPDHIWSVLLENRDRLLSRDIPMARPDAERKDNPSAWARI